MYKQQTDDRPAESRKTNVDVPTKRFVQRNACTTLYLHKGRVANVVVLEVSS